MSDSIAIGRTGTSVKTELTRKVMKTISKRGFSRQHKHYMVRWLRTHGDIVANSKIEAAFIYAEKVIPILAITTGQRNNLIAALTATPLENPRTLYLAAVA